MPAVSWPSEASFSVCTKRSCAVRKSSSDFVILRVRASHFQTAEHLDRITAWSANVVTNSISVRERVNPAARQRDHTDRLALTHERYPYNRANSSNFCLLFFLVKWIGPGVVYSSDLPNYGGAADSCPRPRRNWRLPARFQDKLHRHYGRPRNGIVRPPVGRSRPVRHGIAAPLCPRRSVGWVAARTSSGL